MTKLKKISLPEIFLVNTQLPENLGAVTRAMQNFNFRKLSLISPEFSLDHEKIRPVSAGADLVLNNIKIFDDFDSAIKKINILVGTSNRNRSIKQKEIDFNELIKLLYNTETKVGIVFGPERSGLDNNHIALCDYVLKIKTSNNFSSINLSHAVIIVCYEISKYLNEENPEKKSNNAAKKEDLLNFLVLLEEDLEAKKFFLVQERKKIMVQKIRNIFNKLELSGDDIKILIGIFKALKKTNK